MFVFSGNFKFGTGLFPCRLSYNCPKQIKTEVKSLTSDFNIIQGEDCVKLKQHSLTCLSQLLDKRTCNLSF